MFVHLPFDLSRKNQYILANSKLHDAILENDSKEVAKIVEEDKEFAFINYQSLLNTPLTLALKHGSSEIAKLILEKVPQNELMLNLQDCRGLTALDIACMLRQDDIIKIILSSPYLDINADPLAMILYRDNVGKEILKSYLSTINSENVAGLLTESHSPCSAILMHEPYTDLMIFYLKPICCNLGWMRPDQFGEQFGASYVWFYQCFKKGYETFCDKRNASPVDKELLEAMKNQTNLEKWQDKQHSSRIKDLAAQEKEQLTEAKPMALRS